VVEAPAESVTSTPEWRPSLLEILPHHFVLRAGVDQGTLLQNGRCGLGAFLSALPSGLSSERMYAGMDEYTAGARGSVVLKALYYKPGGRGFDPDEMNF
jgi:hypothetical protein